MPPDPPSFQGLLLFVTGTPDNGISREETVTNQYTDTSYLSSFLPAFAGLLPFSVRGSLFF